MISREELLEHVRTIPALPVCAVQAVEMTQSGDCSTEDLLRVVEVDPALTSAVLRAANSTYYRGRGEIVSVRDAIVRMGNKAVAQLVMGAAVAPLARQPVKGYDLPGGALLDNAVGVAVGVEEVAKALGRPAPPAGFTAGLLHDLGKIVLGTYLAVDPAPIRTLAFQEGLSWEKAEREVLGVDHAEVGAELLASWNLPDSITEVVRWHHQPEEYEGPHRETMDLVHVADTLARLASMGTGMDGLNYTPDPAVIERLRVTNALAETVISRIATGVRELGTAFGPANKE